jgi:hypothetical protein
VAGVALALAALAGRATAAPAHPQGG